MNMQKRDRQDLILNLISSERIGRQDILAERLSQKGFQVTQASVSRDLEELGVEKVEGYYELPKTPPVVIEFGLRSLETAGTNLIVGKCDSGLASAITVRIDGGRIDEDGLDGSRLKKPVGSGERNERQRCRQLGPKQEGEEQGQHLLA